MAACPRCKLTMQPDEYEGVAVLFCGTCWGHWVTHEAMAKILASQEYDFEESEAESVRGAIFEAWSEAESGDATQLEDALCPDCGQPMVKGPFSTNCAVEVDRCETHGIWLDTSEVKQVQVHYESRGNESP